MDIRSRSVFLLFSSLLLVLLAGCRVAQPGEAVPATVTPALAAAASATPESPAPESPLATIETPAAPELPSATPTPAVSPTPTAPPTAPALPVGGVELHSLTEGGGLGLLRDTQTYWLRYNALRWDLIEAVPGQRDWSQVAALEQGLQNAAAEGYQLI
ncbi:MAG: hypothetical protein JW862_17810, partial [Anaerolineales bacterium]|nr:hypothetical protein [Anaerolineales bacterium]